MRLYCDTANATALHDDRTAEVLARFQYYLRFLLDDFDLEAIESKSAIGSVSRYQSQCGHISRCLALLPQVAGV
jgi:hypothetical protein